MRSRKYGHVYGLLALLVLAGLRPERTLADGMNCSGTCVDGKYSYELFGGTVTVDGPNGVEVFAPIETPTIGFLVNEHGGFVVEIQDFLNGAGQYITPGDGYPNNQYNGYLQLGPPPSAAYVQSVCPTCESQPIGSSQETHVLVTGLSDTTVSGFEVFGYDDNLIANGGQFSIEIPAEWGLGGGTPLPEPSSLVLLGTGLLSTVGVIRRKRLS